MGLVNGIKLPPPTFSRGYGLVQPPPAWLIIDDQATAATYGGFCYSHWTRLIRACADLTAPQHIANLATAQLPAGQCAIVVIGSGAVKEFRAPVRTWWAEIEIDPVTIQFVEWWLRQWLGPVRCLVGQLGRISSPRAAGDLHLPERSHNGASVGNDQPLWRAEPARPEDLLRRSP